MLKRLLGLRNSCEHGEAKRADLTREIAWVHLSLAHMRAALAAASRARAHTSTPAVATRIVSWQKRKIDTRKDNTTRHDTLQRERRVVEQLLLLRTLEHPVGQHNLGSCRGGLSMGEARRRTWAQGNGLGHVDTPLLDLQRLDHHVCDAALQISDEN